MIGNFLMVALGGAIGASLRYALGLALAGPGFPLAVLAANIAGSFLMGAFVGAAAARGLAHLSPFVMTGLLGGFTTFSAFSYETVTLIDQGEVAQAALYVLLSVGLSIAALILGLTLAHTFS